MTAPQAAGVIHSDFEKGFIRAETVAYDAFAANKGIPGCKEKGQFRLEGKEYVVNEGDILNFRFNVWMDNNASSMLSTQASAILPDSAI